MYQQHHYHNDRRIDRTVQHAMLLQCLVYLDLDLYPWQRELEKSQERQNRFWLPNKHKNLREHSLDNV